MDQNLDGFRHAMVCVRDVAIHAVTGGEGPPLVLLYGFPQTWWEWRKMMPLLARHYTVVALDLRGAGHSDTPQGGYDKASLAADVHGVTHVAWRRIAPALAMNHTVIIPDLPGYGASRPDRMVPRWTKRRAGAALVALMSALSHDGFAIVGHDRGARVG